MAAMFLYTSSKCLPYGLATTLRAAEYRGSGASISTGISVWDGCVLVLLDRNQLNRDALGADEEMGMGIGAGSRNAETGRTL
jgi:hypothetical protein